MLPLLTIAATGMARVYLTPLSGLDLKTPPARARLKSSIMYLSSAAES